MITDRLGMACEVTGFVPKHAHAALSVAERLNCIILFREPGAAVQGLIEEGHAMKGFRVDTKSCNWGPMSGFVCMDPRLTKDDVYEGRNAHWTHESLSGSINEKFFGKVTDAAWKGGAMPIVLSPKRVAELTAKKVISPRTDMHGHLLGESKALKGSAKLSWRLIPVGNRQMSSNLKNGKVVKEEIVWLRGATPQHMVLCIDTKQVAGFDQRYPEGLEKPVSKAMFAGYETVLGLTNPGTDSLGFKACVTADYDLLAVWAGSKNGDIMAQQHTLSGIFQGNKPLPGGVKRMFEVDDRLQAQGHREHHRYGDVSARIMNVKALLNSAIQNPGGNAVHHNDEAGNVALAKGSLADCLPAIGFVPSVLGNLKTKTAGQGKKTVLLQTVADFRELVEYARVNHFAEVLKPSWYGEMGLKALA